MVFTRKNCQVIPCWRGGAILVGAVLWFLLMLLGAGRIEAEVDICGCAGSPSSVGHFDSSDQSTWPPGTTFEYGTMTIPLPEDGVLIFDGFTVAPPQDYGYINIKFAHNDANSPVTILVAGNVSIAYACALYVTGAPGGAGYSSPYGEGGLGGPGGFRGGDGAYQLVKLSADGATGLGPGGGVGGKADQSSSGEAGVFAGTPELLPLIGGSGGGGGASQTNEQVCAGGGGGGGGGALLIAANGTVALNGSIDASGGWGGAVWGADCATSAGRGSGGAVRLIAKSIEGTGYVSAYGGNPGAIRLETPSNKMNLQNFSPAPIVSLTIGPLSSPLAPSLAFTTINGQAAPEKPRGVFGEIDVTLTKSGPTVFELEGKGVPGGTTVELKVKPRLGGETVTGSLTFEPSNCDSTGKCLGSATLDLQAGVYTAEARATFETP